MNSQLYRSFLRLFEKWPLDQTKQGRDLGEHIRKIVGEGFSNSKPQNTTFLESIHSSLTRVASDRYKQLYFLQAKSASGFTEQQCHEIVSNECLKLMEEEDKGIIKKVFTRNSVEVKGLMFPWMLVRERVVNPYYPMRCGYCTSVKGLADNRETHRNYPIENKPLHIPVMHHEVISLLKPQPGQTIVDMTCGSGAHAQHLLESIKDLRIFGLDRDPLAYELGNELAKKYPGQFIPMLGRFSEVSTLLEAHNITEVDGVFFDLGCSSMQFDDPTRGFSISNDGPLDMRMDGNRYPNQPTAADLIEHVDEHHLARILKVYGEEKQAKKIARAIVEARYMFKSLKRTSELASLILSVLDNEQRLDKLSRPTHTATKCFQAIRIFINNEMNELNRGIELAHKILKFQGTLVVLTFHSLEDRIVKRHLTGIDMDEPVSKTISQKYRNAASWHTLQEVDNIFNKKWEVVNKHVLIPRSEEVNANPRSRSAKLRCAVKN